MDSFLLSLLKAISIPILGYFLATKFNFFKYITFIPKDHMFEAAITTYFAILEMLITKISKNIESNLKAHVKCLFYSDASSQNINNIPSFSFTDYVVFIRCMISIKGGARILSKESLIISFPDWVDIQEVNGSVGIVNEKNQFIVDLNKLICNDDKTIEEATADIKIGLIKISSQDNFTKIIVPTLSGKFNFLINFDFNKFELKNLQ